MKCIFFNTLVLDRLLVTKLGCLMLKNQFLYALTRNSVGLFCRFFFIGSDMEVKSICFRCNHWYCSVHGRRRHRLHKNSAAVSGGSPEQEWAERHLGSGEPWFCCFSPWVFDIVTPPCFVYATPHILGWVNTDMQSFIFHFSFHHAFPMHFNFLYELFNCSNVR
jgi:hypothetical protein